jgi:LL-diaminopimelate aminotransferase
MKTSKRLNGIGEYYFSKKLREIEDLNKQGRNIINLGIGSPDLPPHPDVIKMLQEEAAKPNVHGYQSYKGSAVLRNAIADWYKRSYNVTIDPTTDVLPLIGSKEGIMHICMTYLNKGDVALVPDPGYPTYTSAVHLAGAKTVSYQLKEKNNYFPDWKKLERIKLKKVKIMFVNYPQMPTGQLPSLQLFEQIIAFGKKNKILIVHDNPYSFILNEQPLSILSVDGAMDIAVELNSLSKSHNMAGWRIGMLCGAADRVEEVLRFKSNMDSGMFLPIQLAAAKALSLGKEWHDHLNKTYAERRNEVFEILDRLGCSYSKEQAGLFLWAKIPGHFKDSYAMSDETLSRFGVFITPGGIFGKAGNKYVRISLCSTMERFKEAKERFKLS